VDEGVRCIPAVDNLRVDVEVLREAEMALDSLAVGSRERGKIFFQANENGDAAGVEIVGDTASATQEHRGSWINRDVDANLCVGFGGFFLCSGASLEGLRSLANGEFAERDQRRLLKEALRLGFGALGRVDGAALEAVKQGARSDVDQNDLVGLLK